MGFSSGINGCGACGGFWKWFKPPHHKFFIGPCNVHDSLYSTGGNRIDRKIADLILLNNMRKLVLTHFKGRKLLSRVWYIVVCYFYYLAVRFIGFTLFNYK